MVLQIEQVDARGWSLHLAPPPRPHDNPHCQNPKHLTWLIVCQEDAAKCAPGEKGEWPGEAFSGRRKHTAAY